MLLREVLGRVWGDQILVECDAGPSAGSVAERVSALARRDLLRQKGGDADGEERDGLHVDGALGVVAFSGVDGTNGARDANETGNREQPIAGRKNGEMANLLCRAGTMHQEARKKQ